MFGSHWGKYYWLPNKLFPSYLIYLICLGLKQPSLKLGHDAEYICKNAVLEYFIRTPWSYYEFTSDQMRPRSAMITKVHWWCKLHWLYNAVITTAHNSLVLDITKNWVTNKMKHGSYADLNKDPALLCLPTGNILWIWGLLKYTPCPQPFSLVVNQLQKSPIEKKKEKRRSFSVLPCFLLYSDFIILHVHSPHFQIAHKISLTNSSCKIVQGSILRK